MQETFRGGGEVKKEDACDKWFILPRDLETRSDGWKKGKRNMRENKGDIYPEVYGFW